MLMNFLVVKKSVPIVLQSIYWYHINIIYANFSEVAKSYVSQAHLFVVDVLFIQKNATDFHLPLFKFHI